jgi:hypothetical protein
MSRLTARELALSEESGKHWDDLNAILAAFLPSDLQHRCSMLVDELKSNAFAQCYEAERALYAALVAALPDHLAEIRRAYQSTVLEDCAEDWPGYEAGDPPTLRLVK